MPLPVPQCQQNHRLPQTTHKSHAAMDAKLPSDYYYYYKSRYRRTAAAADNLGKPPSATTQLLRYTKPGAGSDHCDGESANTYGELT